MTAPDGGWTLRQGRSTEGTNLYRQTIREVIYGPFREHFSVAPHIVQGSTVSEILVTLDDDIV